MLIDKGVTAGNVVSLKLTSGEEIVAKLIEETDAYYKLGRPMVIAMGAQGPGLNAILVHCESRKRSQTVKDHSYGL